MISPVFFISIVAAAERPWYMSAASQSFEEFAVAARKTDVPLSSMKSVARELAEGALAPPGFTSLATEAANLYLADGPKPNPTSVYNLVSGLSSVHESIKTDPVYSEYISYAQNAASNFDMEVVSSLFARPTSTASIDARLQDVHSENRQRHRAEYSAFAADPSGRAALSLMREVGQDFIGDFNQGSDASHLINSAIQYIANIV